MLSRYSLLTTSKLLYNYIAYLVPEKYLVNKAVVIILSIVWLISMVYHILAGAYGYPFANGSMIVSWIASAMLLIFIVIYIKKNKDTMK